MKSKSNEFEVALKSMNDPLSMKDIKSILFWFGLKIADALTHEHDESSKAYSHLIDHLKELELAIPMIRKRMRLSKRLSLGRWIRTNEPK